MSASLDKGDRADGICVKYIYSACIVTATPDVRVLHDPWFTEGVYDGAWFHFPEVKDPIAAIGNVDLIYVSHIHPDHYDAAFLKRYFSVYGLKEVLIAHHEPNHLAGKMGADGIKATVLQSPREIGRTRIEILPHKTGSVSDIDSAMIIQYTGTTRRHCVVNANDIIFDDATIATLKQAAGEVDVLLCGYTGAGPYPQTYFDRQDPQLVVAADAKREAFFGRYRRLTSAIGASRNVPFAGKYLLGAKLTELNDVRGVADATDCLAFDPNAVVLADEGGEICTSDLKPTAVRSERYPEAAIRKREAALRSRELDYERLFNIAEVHQLPIKRLLVAAVRKAAPLSECDSDYYFVIGLPGDEVAIINANRAARQPITFGNKTAALPEPRSEIHVDPRYLFGLLSNIYHWNNAEIGSLYHTRRFPNVHHRKAQSYLSFLRV